jgi:predicted N-acetyltransferase YhbS
MSQAERPVPYTIRPAVWDEIPEIESVIVAAYNEFREYVPEAVADAYLEDSRHVGDHWHETQVLIAEFDGRIAGAVLFYADAGSEGLGWPKDWVGFRRLAVHPALRGRGIGRMLVNGCVNSARALGASTVGIHTAAFMKAACDLYERIGFRRCSEYDLSISTFLGLDEGAGEIIAIAYRLDLASPR